MLICIEVILVFAMDEDTTVCRPRTAEDTLCSVLDIPSDANEDTDLECAFDSNEGGDARNVGKGLDPLSKAQSVNDPGQMNVNDNGG